MKSYMKRSPLTFWMQARTWTIDRLRILEELRPQQASPFEGLKQQLERDLILEAKLLFEHNQSK